MTHYKPLCHDAWAIPPTPLMLKHGNNYHTCSKCGEPVETVNLKDAAMTTPLSNNINDRADDIKRQHISKLSNAELGEALYPFGNAAQIVGSKRVELYDVVRTLITSQKAICEKEARLDELRRAYPELMKHHGLHGEGNYYYNDRIAQLSTEDVKNHEQLR